ncbi:MAG: hypothetical protein ABSA66_15730 [Roseiarcus sp.]|jgi:hypothetical protein
MFKTLAPAYATLACALGLAGCSTSAVQQFAQNAATTATAIGTVNNALIQLDTTTINNLTQLSQALAGINCPIVNAGVSLGRAIAADPSVAKNVKAALTKAGPGGALASDVCVAAGFGPSTPATAAPDAAVTPTPGS